MKRIFIFLSLIIVYNSALAQPNTARPKLVMGIVVDQMRQEYLSRFYNHFGEGGFKRILNDGYEFRNAHYNYFPTKTGPGHASIYTGTTPRTHGILENEWYDKDLQKKINCVEDNDVVNVGGSSAPGKRSPKNLMCGTVTDEMRMFFQDRTKILSISIKDRGAILPGGHNPDGTYWYDDKTGQFMSSTYYQSELPAWVVAFNKEKWPQKYQKKTWDTYFPIETYIESDEDHRPFERSFLKDAEPVFPYDLKMASSKKSFGFVRNSPFGNSILVELALDAIMNEQLGYDDITDFLAISFSATDYIGHAHGPYSKEIQDTYIRLDRELERLFNELDQKVGKDSWSMFLTSDHAVAAIPKAQAQKKQLGSYWKIKEKREEIKIQIETYFESAGLVEAVEKWQVYFDKKVITENNLDIEVVKKYAINYLLTLEGVVGAYDVARLHTYQGNSLDIMKISAGLNLKRSGDVIFTLGTGWIHDGYIEGGTDHGSFYAYDTHVPMIFYGKGFNKGMSVEYRTITSIAPTISMLLNIGLPDGATGQPLREVLKIE